MNLQGYELPVLVIGVAAGLLLGKMSKSRSQANRGKKNVHGEDYMTEGLSTGMMVGAVLGLMGVMDILLAIGISSVAGLVVGLNIKKK